MDQSLISFTLFGHLIALTAWQIIGQTGNLLCAGRWGVQFVASHYLRRPVLPRLFWYMSIGGSVLLLAYFIWGKCDSVGIVSNVFPGMIAVYNLYLDVTHHRRQKAEEILAAS